jgi:hypothetical protein
MFKTYDEVQMEGGDRRNKFSSLGFRKQAPIKGKKILKMLQWIRMGPKSENGQRKPIWEAYSLYIRPCHKETYWKNFCIHGRPQRWKIIAKVCGENITIDQVLIAHQFGVSVKGGLNAANMLVKEAQTALKNIVGMDAFVNKEQWSTICMTKDFHVKFVAMFITRIPILFFL